MKRRAVPLAILALALIALLTGYSATRGSDPAYASSTASPPAAGTVDFSGARGAPLGASDAVLTSQGAMAHPQAACGPTLTTAREAHPVLADGRLVLLWVNPPLTTPEGVGVGSTVEQARAAYPDASTLTAPAGSYQFDGLMVTNGDKAYLFMHDGHTVRKAVVGYTDYVQRLFTTGVGAC